MNRLVGMETFPSILIQIEGTYEKHYNL